VIEAMPSGARGGPCELPPDRRDFALLAEHMDSAFNLARYLMRNETEAEDVVQSAYLRAISHFTGFRGGDGRAWLLTIVRNSCYDRLKKLGLSRQDTDFDETMHSRGKQYPDPETALLLAERSELLRKSLAELPAESREVLILRELEGLSYREIADIAGVPIGTVMSRLSRARQRLQQGISAHLDGGKNDGAPLPASGTKELSYGSSDDLRRNTWSERN
jgi:RNA polymerase sigma-70 factor, ECF subfamily